MEAKNIIRDFLRGALDRGVLQMILIFILAGAFAGIARNIGAVEATVAATLGIIPASMIYAGLFITACLISFSVGTSMGTIAAVVPIACGIAQDTGDSLPYMVGIVVGGAFFGDNLSFISDTTLAATRALGVKMRDKFRANFMVVLPAVLLSLCIYVLLGLSQSSQVPPQPQADAAKLIPYIIVIVLALCGLGVIRILCIGVTVCILTGLATGAASAGMLGAALDGVLGMTSVIIVALVAGGLLNVIKSLGWFENFVQRMEKTVSSRRGAMASIAALVSITNIFTANNTVAILSVGGIAKDIAVRYKLNRRQTAGVLDMFSCLTQSLLPYGAQLLMASAFAGISAVSIIPWLFYPLLMGVCATVSILRIK